MVLNVAYCLPHFKRLLSEVLNYIFVAATLQFSPPVVSNKLPRSLAC